MTWDLAFNISESLSISNNTSPSSLLSLETISHARTDGNLITSPFGGQ